MLFIDKDIIIRNGSDVFLRNIFLYFDYHSYIIYSVTLLIVFLGIIKFNFQHFKEKSIKFNFLLFMLFESVIWSLVLLILLMSFDQFLLYLFNSSLLIENLYLAIGAGIWEELMFRVICMGMFIFLFNKILKYNYIISVLLGLLISSILFSSFHYIGPLGEEFIYKTFYLRTFAGIILGLIYLYRGFGITSYVHILYNVYIVSFPVILNRSNLT